MRSKEIRSISETGGLTSRRELLRRSAAIAAVSVIAPVWTRLARAQTAATFDYYISTTGSDSNPGTLASPWALTAINSKRSTYAGKRLGIIAGTYDCLAIFGGSYSSVGNRAPVYNIQGGSSGSPTYLGSSDANGNYSPRVAILNGNSNENVNPNDAAIIGFDATNGAGYVVFDGFEVKNGNLQLTVWSGTNITVKNCYMHGSTTSSTGNNPALIWLNALSNSLIQNNYVTDVSAPNDSRAPCSGIQGYSCNNIVLEYNTVVQTNANPQTMSNGINFKDLGQYNNTIRYNFIYMPYAANIQVDAIGTDSAGTATQFFDIHHNVVVAQEFTSDYIGGQPSPWPMVNIENWYNNTFVGNPNLGTPAGWGFNRTSSAQTINYYNNIIQRGLTANQGDVFITDVSPNVWDYNIYPASPSLNLYSGTSHSDDYSETTLSGWQGALKTATGGKCVGQDAHSVLFSDRSFGGSAALFQGVQNSGDPSTAAYYKLVAGGPGSASGTHPGSSNGLATGTPIDMGAWGGVDVNTGQPIAQIGSSFVPGSAASSTTAPPAAPVLSVS
jgi:hypothetical protein